MTELLLGNNKDLLEEMEDESIDALVTDPPYLINFMGKDWDKENSPAGDADFWALVMKKMKPGAHGLIFGHSRQHHRVMTALEDAGFEIRDCLMWLYGSGFPKSHNIGKAINAVLTTGGSAPKNFRKARMGDNYEPTGQKDYRKGRMFSSEIEQDKSETELCDQAKDWDGWGTALKPAYEPIIMVRRPVEKKLTVAKNTLKHGVGGINIDECRISSPGETIKTHSRSADAGKDRPTYGDYGAVTTHQTEGQKLGRWPANVMLDEEAAKMLDKQSGTTKSSKRGSKYNKKTENRKGYTPVQSDYREDNTYGDKGGASRFFYCPKVSKKERNFGCDGLEEKERKRVNAGGLEHDPKWAPVVCKNDHPTVKPIALMRYLIKLITPEGGKVLDPFMGSGSTGMAAVLEGKDFVGMEMDKNYLEIAEARVAWAVKEITEAKDK